MQIDSSFQLVDIYSTKGLEYLIAAAFFVCMIFLVKGFIYYNPWRKIKIEWDKNKDVQSKDDKV